MEGMDFNHVNILKAKINIPNESASEDNLNLNVDGDVSFSSSPGTKSRYSQSQ